MPPATSSPVQRVLDAVKKFKTTRSGFLARCPAHEDAVASLSIGQGKDGRALLNCHAGCDLPDIVRGLGLDMADIFPDSPGRNGGRIGGAIHPRGYRIGAQSSTSSAYRPNGAPISATATAAELHPDPEPADEPAPPPPDPARDPAEDTRGWPVVATYDYTDADGATVLQVLRKEPPVQPTDGKRRKTFTQRRPDGAGGWTWESIPADERPLYRLPEVIEALGAERTVYLVEGEKDADTLAEAGYTATTVAGGANAWSEAHGAILRDARVVILPDNDDSGRAYAEQAAATLAASGCVVQMCELPDLPPKGDVTDWLDAGRTLDDLDAIVAATPRWRPAGERDQPKVCWRLDELWEDDAVMRPPPPVVPRIAWGARSTLLAAPEKGGKSTLTGYIATAVSRGFPFLDEPCEQGTVLIVGLEEYIGDAARRLREFGADATRVYLMDRLPGDPRERPRVVRERIEAIRPTLVILDTLMAYANGSISDASSSSQMQPLVQDWTDVAHETGVAVVLVHHARKADGRYRDSSAIGGAVDVIIELFAPDEDADPTLRRARARGRVPVSSFDFRFDGSGYHMAAGSSASPEDRIVDYLRANPGTSHRALRQHIGGRSEKVDLAIRELMRAGKIMDEGTGEHRSYRLPFYGRS